MLKVAVAGAGHLAKIHLRLWKELEGVAVVGVYDIRPDVARSVAEAFNVPFFDNLPALLDAADVVDIVTATVAHAEVALAAIACGKHIFVEKPLASNHTDGLSVVKALRQTCLKGQVGHVERFNPAFLSVQDHIANPLFIETHRLAQYNPRGADVSVVHDLMIHDLDILLSLVKAPVREVRASGVAIVSPTPDIANARIAFENGCVANITASRLSLKYMRKTRIFQRDAYISIDFLEKKAETVRLSTQEPTTIPFFPLQLPHIDTPRYLVFETPDIQESNAIKTELAHFADSIRYDRPEIVPLEDGLRAMELVEQVLFAMEENLNMALL